MQPLTQPAGDAAGNSTGSGALRAPSRPRLPSGPLLVGYTTWSECGDGKVVRAVERGVNVLVWFAIELVLGSSGAAVITGGPNLTCVAETATGLAAAGLRTTHMISVGGWDAPHPVASVSAEAWWRAWSEWNAAAAREGWGGFDGIDWDLEGNDDASSPWNGLSAGCLRLVSRLSALARRDGLLVSIAPPASYLDPSTPDFSLRLDLPPRGWHPDFRHAGRNAYAALLALGASDGWSPDFVSVQLYESWSPAHLNISARRQPAASYLPRLARAYADGWRVRFSAEPSLNLSDRSVRVPPSALVFGLANGWARAAALGGKVLVLPSADAAAAWRAMERAGGRPAARGFMFWDISDEGEQGWSLARDLGRVLRTRADAAMPS